MNLNNDNENIYKLKFDLISDTLNAKAEKNKYIDEFSSLIEIDFKTEFCSTDRGKNTNDAEAIRDFDYILNEMKLIANCPKLYSKRIGAMGGSFSSGKSSFINSFIIDSKIELAEDISPTTAIPSYIISDKESMIQGISYDGGKFAIELDMYKKIDHDFLESLPFDLKKILKYTIVLAPMKDDLFENICLIDTPGYDASGHGTTKKDYEIAQEYIKTAQFLIWVVNIEKGTIIKTDLDFLEQLEFGKGAMLPLYVIANKADKEPENEIENILNQFVEDLKNYGIKYEGISAYSSSDKKVFSSRKSDIYKFLKNYNKPNEIYNEIKDKIYNVFKKYIIQIDDDHKDMQRKRKLVNKLLWDAFENRIIGIDETEASNKFEEGLNELLHCFETKEEKEKHIQRVVYLRKKFLDCFNNFCDSMNIAKNEKKYCTYCGNQIEAKHNFCTQCGKKLG
jgi:GTP-binding protein EngB required for normal cell division